MCLCGFLSGSYRGFSGGGGGEVLPGRGLVGSRSFCRVSGVSLGSFSFCRGKGSTRREAAERLREL